MINNELITSSGSLAMGLLADYVSSPSSTGSWMFYDLPDMLISTGGRTQTQVVNDDRNAARQHSSRLLWLKKPYLK